jgi:hypothetical protein
MPIVTFAMELRSEPEVWDKDARAPQLVLIT